MSRLRRLLTALAVTVVTVQPAAACLGCGCGGSGSAADMGSLTATAGLFSQGRHWLLQQGIGLRSITGSFNELGTWSPVPVGGSLHTLQGTLALQAFPWPNLSLGITLPAALNVLNKASWGPFGSIAPTDLPLSLGTAVGDISTQVAVRCWEGDHLALSAWGGLNLPSGRASGDPVSLTGSGLWSGQLGLTGVGQWGDWEAIASLGGQLPLGTLPEQATAFTLGPSLLFQAQTSYLVTEAWRLGLTASGYLGQTMVPANPLATGITAKWKLMPQITWQWRPTQGVRAGLGFDPQALGLSSMTDTTMSLVFFEYL